MSNVRAGMRGAGSVAAVAALVGLIGVIAVRWPPLFERLSQEDGPIEWATFWSFALAAVVAVIALAKLPRVQRNVWTWTLHVGVVLGCVVVALEEISWGQRVFGYRPPDLFLFDNFQQELNFHNLVDAQARKTGVLVLLVGYGVLLPMVRFVPPLRAWLDAQHVQLPGLALMPLFLTAVVLYVWYPWPLIGEWIEWLAGLGLLIGVLELLAANLRLPSWLALLAGSLPLAMGLLTVQLVPAGDPEQLARAELETGLLAEDFRLGRFRSGCGLHARMVEVANTLSSSDLEDGAFATRMASDALGVARGRHYLDPWHLSYWVRHSCSAQREVVFIYSFGPNRRRDSRPWSLDGDDVGIVLVRPRKDG